MEVVTTVMDSGQTGMMTVGMARKAIKEKGNQQEVVFF